jgi:hypothetical protein
LEREGMYIGRWGMRQDDAVDDCHFLVWMGRGVSSGSRKASQN